VTTSLRRFHFAIALYQGLICADVAGANPQEAGGLTAEYEALCETFSESVPGNRPAAPRSGLLLFVARDQFTPQSYIDDDDIDHHRDQRKKYADVLFELATRAAAAGELSFAFQWATEAVRENPDHADARRVLGYERRDGQWLTPYGVRMADAGKVWHVKFGWIAPSDEPRYAAGERYVAGRWLSAEDAAARHREMKNGWQLRTDHFLVTTNHGLEAAAELAARLERLHQVWRQLFAGFYLTEREVAALFSGERPPRRQVRPFRVYYHRTREEYVAALRSRQPRIAETLGIYFDTHRQAHFFAGTDENPATLYHEAVHQLFQESQPAARQIGGTSNFWVIEGVATYFETLTELADPQAGLYFTVGDSTAGRLPAAQERLADGFYIPLAELTRLGKDEVQRHPDIAKLYSQSTGLTAYLMHAQDGRFREPLVRYLSAVYAGRDDGETLAELTGQNYAGLDVEYRRFMESLP
jgi:hypothetical protein